VSDTPGPVYLRIPEETTKGPAGSVETLTEVMPDGYVGRDIGIGADGEPVYVTRGRDAGTGPYEHWGPGPPGTPAFDEWWGRYGTPISAEEFDSVYARADATLPWTYGGTPQWISSVVFIGCLVVFGAVALGILVAVLSIVNVI
jgi:hypothetical protein